ncbi:MAG: CPBP family intramembrane metalloprotease [Alphaproteobacteria bacterium]|nr:CPBP family intramembrane metalloprotease [Alphaproteobacteria bacterium]
MEDLGRRRWLDAVRAVDLRRAVPAWAAAQVGVGVLTGLATATLVLSENWAFHWALLVTCAAALPLVPVSAWLVYRTLGVLARMAATAREAMIGVGALVGFTLTAPLVLVATSLGLGVAMAVAWAPDLVGHASPDAVLRARLDELATVGLPPWVLATGSLLLLGAGAVLAVAWTFIAHRVRSGRWAHGTVALGAVGTRRVQVLAAVVGGLSMGWLPALIAEHLASNAAWLERVDAFLPGTQSQSLPWLQDALTRGSGAGAALMMLVVAGVGPLVEEVVFRGFLWDALRRWLPAGVVIGVTSVLFALAHLDPVHTPAVLFIGLFLGWLRWTSGSIWPGVVAHVVNNGIGVVLATRGFGGVDIMRPETAWALGAMTVVVAAAAYVAGRVPRAVVPGRDLAAS